MFIGHYTLGQLLPLRLWVVNANGDGVEPDTAPVVFVYSRNSQACIASYQLAAADQNVVDGWFECAASLDNRYAVGRYTNVYQFTISGTTYARQEQWEIVAGGDGVGSGVGVYFYRQPQADFLLMQTDRGILKAKRNPRVT